MLCIASRSATSTTTTQTRLIIQYHHRAVARRKPANEQCQLSVHQAKSSQASTFFAAFGSAGGVSAKTAAARSGRAAESASGTCSPKGCRVTAESPDIMQDKVRDESIQTFTHDYACLPTCYRTCLRTHLPTYEPTCLLAFLPASLAALLNLPTHLTNQLLTDLHPSKIDAHTDIHAYIHTRAHIIIIHTVRQTNIQILHILFYTCIRKLWHW